MRTVSKIISQSKDYDLGLRSYMLGIYNFMTIGLSITAIVASLGARSGISIAIMKSPLGFIISLAPVIISMYMGFSFHKMSADKVKGLFFGYSALMGISLSTIFVVFKSADITRALLCTASVFGGMSIYGYTTKKDLTSIASFATMIVIGILISSLINIFLIKSGPFDFLLSILSVIMFTLLTAYDTQKLKQLYYKTQYMDSELSKKMAIFGAMQLYVDFIAIFIHLLRILNSNKRND